MPQLAFKPRVLCFASWFLPGFQAGGPVRSLLRTCEWLQDDFDFRVVTRDTDLGATTPYPNLTPGRWYPAGPAQVWHLTAPYWRPSILRAVVADARPDLLYFHSFMDPALGITPMVLRRLGLLAPGVPVLLAPRGEFSPGALGLKSRKKAAYLRFAGATGVYRDVTWQATDAQEAGYIRAQWGPEAQVQIAPNLPPRAEEASTGGERLPKQAGTLRLVFLSRISPMKNLTGALRALATLTTPASLDIYGTLEDKDYWGECERLIRALPGHIQVRYRGWVQPEAVIGVLSGYDAFLLPSLGENFGHVILEALLAGCPVVLSDRTPWRDLTAERVGFDVSLAEPAPLAAALSQLASLGPTEFALWGAAARAYGLRYCHNPDLPLKARSILEFAMAPRRAGERSRAK